MKTSININLFGTVYAIDEDARQLLDQYFSSMRSYFGKQQGGDEIADDIEHRVAEHFWRLKQEGTQSISIEQVTQIMHEIGNPEEMGTDEEKPATDAEPRAILDPQPEPDGEQRQESHNHTYGQQEGSQGRGKRQFYRDPREKILGGVLAGTCHYFGWDDPLMLRILFVVLCLLTEGLPMWIYLLLWVIAPSATTAEQRLRMKGRAVNPETIKSEVLDGGTPDSDPSASNNGGCLKVLLGVAVAPFGCLFAFIAFVVIMVLFGVFSGVFGAFSGLLFGGDEIGLLMDASRTAILLMVLCVLAAIALPLYLLWRWFRRDTKPMSGLSFLILAGLWLLAVLAGCHYGAQLKDRFENADWNLNFPNANIHWQTSTSYGPTDDDEEEGTTEYGIVSVADFDRIDFAGVGQVVFRQGDDCSVEVGGDYEMVRHTLISSEDGLLKIEPEQNTESKEGKLRIKVTAPMLKRLDVKGVGTFEIDGTLEQSEPLAISMEGVGKISADQLACPAIELKQKGVGACEFGVETDDLKVEIEGVGKMTLTGHAKRYSRRGGELLSHIDDESLMIDN